MFWSQFLQPGKHPYPAGISLRFQSVCCCCQLSRPDGSLSPSCCSPFGKWSHRTLCHRYWNTIAKHRYKRWRLAAVDISLSFISSVEICFLSHCCPMIYFTSISCLSLYSCSDSHAGVKLDVIGLVSKGKVVLGQFGFGSVKSQLIASQPALVAQHSSCVDGGTGHVEVQVAAHIDKVTLVASLQFGTLLATEGIIYSCSCLSYASVLNG